MRSTTIKTACLFLFVGLLPSGCNSRAMLFNPSFVNFTTGGVVPLTPGPASRFVLVRVINNIDQSIEFVVTAEREVEVSEGGALVTQTQLETQRLLTFPVGNANELGVLFECPITRVGLGENLNNPVSEPALFLGAVAGGIGGFGVPAGINPLDARAGNFTCGDTLVFQTNVRAGTVGGIEVRTFVLAASEQPTAFNIDTFNNVRRFIDQQSPGDDDD